MSALRLHSRPALRLAVLAVAALVGAAPRAQSREPVARYTAFAVDLGNQGAAAAGTVEMVVNRWSTTGERDRLLKVLIDRGPDRLLEALQDTPHVGYIRTPDSIGYDLRFARQEPGEDGAEMVTLVTDRYISFWEAYYRPRTIDYPFTVIELRLNRQGEGEGRMSLATRITADSRNRIVLENYTAQPVLLKQVKKSQ